MDNTQDYKTLAQHGIDDVRAVLLGDGGDIRLVGLSDDSRVVYVSLMGVCAGCMMSEVTLSTLVKGSIKKYIPQVEEVVNVGEGYTDCEGGDTYL